MSSEDYKRLRYKTNPSKWDWFSLKSFENVGFFIAAGVGLIILFFFITQISLFVSIIFSKDYVYYAHLYNYKDISLQVVKGDTLILQSEIGDIIYLNYNGKSLEAKRNSRLTIPYDGLIRFDKLGWFEYSKFYLMSDRREYERSKIESGNNSIENKVEEKSVIPIIPTIPKKKTNQVESGNITQAPKQPAITPKKQVVTKNIVNKKPETKKVVNKKPELTVKAVDSDQTPKFSPRVLIGPTL